MGNVASDTIVPDPDLTVPAFREAEPPKIDEEAAPQDLPFQGVQEAAPSRPATATSSSGTARPVRKCRFF